MSTPVATPTKATQVDEAAAAMAGLNLAGAAASSPAAAAAAAAPTGSNVSVAAPAPASGTPSKSSSGASTAPSSPSTSTPASKVSLESLAAGIATGQFSNIIVLTGAGISVSAGIPDFRTPGTGLYDNLAKYNLPHPTAVFELSYFRRNPHPFLLLAKELYPTGAFRPTPTHHFIRALAEYSGPGSAGAGAGNGAAAGAAGEAEAKTDGADSSAASASVPSFSTGRLLRNFTQNIDGLEGVAGLHESKLIQAHGGFSRAGCIDCQRVYPASFVRDAIFSEPQIVPRCLEADCKALVKPNITFFGEGLPAPFGRAVASDFPRCDLLIVMGTSLKVQPFASLISRVGKHVPRVLINNECVGSTSDPADEEEEEALRSNPQYAALIDQMAHCRSDKMRPMLQSMIDTLRARLLGNSDDKFDFKSGKRDVFVQSDCDSGVRLFARLIGPEFESLLNALIDADKAKAAAAAAENGAAPKAAAGGAGAGAEAMAKAIAASVGGAAASASPSKAPAAAASSASPSKPVAAAVSASSSGPAAASAPSSSASSAPSSSPPRFAVGFDFDHTLGLDHGLELAALRALAREFGAAGEAAAQSESFGPVMSAALKEYRDGRTTQTDMIRAFARLIQQPCNDDDAVHILLRFHTQCFALAPKTTPMDGALELLAWLRSKQIPTAILTNGWSPLQQQKVAASLGDAAPATILVSDEVGSLKPDARAFRALLSAPGFAGVDPARVVYIGDNPGGDIVGAMDAGFKGMWVDMENVPYPQGKRQPDWTVHALSEIRPILERWMEGKEEGKEQANATTNVQSAL